MQYSSKKSIVAFMLTIPGLMAMIYARGQSLLSSSQPYSDLIVYEAVFIAGALGVVLGLILLGMGRPETKKGRLILEAASQKKEFTISEISTQTGFSEEYVRKVISDLMKRNFLSVFLNDDRFEQRERYDG